MAWKWLLTIAGMTVRPPRSTTRSSGPVFTVAESAPVRTVVMRPSSTTTVEWGRAPSASKAVAFWRTRRRCVSSSGTTPPYRDGPRDSLGRGGPQGVIADTQDTVSWPVMGAIASSVWVTASWAETVPDAAVITPNTVTASPYWALA